VGNDRPTQIGGGIQFHHSYNLDRAQLSAVDMVQWLKGVVELTGRPEHQELLDDALALCRRIGERHREAQARLAGHYDADPAHFYQSRMGVTPWPDEIAEGFEPICTCKNRCLVHDTEAPGSTENDCNCEAICPKCRIPREPGDRAPLLQLPPSPFR